MYMFNQQFPCCCVPQIKPRCRVVHRYFYRDVTHICPYHTHVVNHNICRHNYCPQYTCSQENVCQDIHCGSC